MAERSPQWHDEQYNNRARVPASAETLERWTQASALSRENSRCLLDLSYGNESSERLDLFATDVPNAPVLIFIHGGYWRAQDKADHSFVAPAFTDEGAMVLVPNYGLCPAVSIEHIAMQLVGLMAWTWRHIADHGGDPNRIVLVGHSAGAHLAAMLSCCDWKSVAPDLPRHLVKGVLGLSGLYDMAPLRRTPFLQGDLRLTPESVKRLSPVLFPAPEAPTYALVGAAESDEFKRQNRALRQAWGARSVPICEEVAGANHFSILHELVDPQSRVHALARKLLDLRWYSALL